MEVRLFEYYKGTRYGPPNWGYESSYRLLIIGNNVAEYGQTEKLSWWMSLVGFPCGVTMSGFSLLGALRCILSGHVEYVNYDTTYR